MSGMSTQEPPIPTEISTVNEERYYRALESRDERFDGHFFAAVLTTGIYCRPICPAPKPKRSNVRFFPSAAACRRAGFRACRRCAPQSAPGTPEWIGSPALVTRAMRRIHAEPDLAHQGVEGLARVLGISARHVRRLFREHVGASPLAVITTRRLQLAWQLVRETNLPITRIAFASGFQSVRRFQSAYREAFGEAPTSHRRARSIEARAEGARTLRLSLATRPPFRWSQFVRFLAPRVVPSVEQIDECAYERLVEVGSEAYRLRVTPQAEPRGVFVDVPIACANEGMLLEVLERVSRLFDLRADPGTVRDHLREHPVLMHALGSGVVPRLPGAYEPFETAVRCILGQQVTVSGATTLTTRLVERFGARIGRETDGLTHRFPRPEELAEADLASIGLPTRRAQSLRAFARSVCESLLLDGSLALDEFVERACAIDGIGAWTAHVIAMRALSEPDAFPASDLGIRRALGGLSPRAVACAADAFRPWRSYACMVLWDEPEVIER